jgi:hypothetical protein
MKKSLIVCVFALFFFLFFNADFAFSSDTKVNSGSLAIKIEGTRSQFTPGTSFGVLATLTNNTKSIIYLNEHFLILKVPSEIEGPASSPDSIWWGFMPIADHGKKYELNYNATVALQPNDSVAAYWMVDPRYLVKQSVFGGTIYISMCDAIKNIYHLFSTELHFLLFSPGKYKLTVSANYWDKLPVSMGTIPKTSVESIIVDVAAPQSVILFGAALGGLLYYILFSFLNQSATDITKKSSIHFYVKWSWVIMKKISGAITSMLMSTVVTILIARVADTQFPIRITVSDVWGAIAIGFIANYLGIELLNKIKKRTGNISINDNITKSSEKVSEQG